MILVWGPPGDSTMQSALLALGRRNLDVVFVNQAEVLAHHVQLRIDDGLEAWLDVPGGTVDLSQVSAAYIRPHDSADAPAVHQAAAGAAATGAADAGLTVAAGGESPAAVHARQVDDLLLSWADLTPALVVNRPSAMASNDCKPDQTASARAVGFEVPDTLLTTDPEAVREFAGTHADDGVIYKSISGVRSIVTRLEDADLERLGDVGSCPTQFQELVPGTDVRVHVVGDRVFAVEIESDAIDYRYGPSDLRPYDVPADVGERCVELAARLGLELAGVDLRRTPDERWYCFEANPSPAFASFGSEMAADVGDALAAHLQSATLTARAAAGAPEASA